MKKRILSLLLVVTMMIGMLPSVVFAADTIVYSGTCGDNLTWELDGEGTLTISGTGEMDDYGYVSEPWWESRDLIKTVIVCEGVSNIGEFAFGFGYENIEQITIPKSVSAIETIDYFLDNSFKLVSVNVDAGNSHYCSENGVLFDKNKTNLFRFPAASKSNEYVVPNDVKHIARYAFAGCSNLKRVILPGSLESIGESVFLACEKLEDIEIPYGIKRIEESAFAYCEELKNVEIPKSVEFIGGGAFLECVSIKKIVIPDGVTTIESDTFSCCVGLENITIPDSVTVIRDFAFNSCNSLENITLPDDVKSIERYAFHACPGLKSIALPKKITSIEQGTFYSCISLGSIRIPNSVVNIAEKAFYGCASLTDVYFEGSQEEWKALSVDNTHSGNDYLLNATIHFNSDIGSGEVEPPADNDELDLAYPARKVAGEFEYYSNFTKKSEPYFFVYDDVWFFNDPYTYQHDLTKMSIRMAMAGAQTSAVNIKKLYDKLGFSYTTDSINYPTPEYDSIGYAIGSRNIVNENGDEITLVAVTVRGGGYRTEWGGNFRLGTEYEHNGFNIAANSVCNAIKSYITSNSEDIKANIKVWISGFSRAAATTNLVGKKLNDGFIKGISRKDVFAFCFECPQNTTLSENTLENKYGNIVNIVNPIDFVTKVAMSDWDYGRYGLTYYLPSLEISSKYLSLKNEMLKEYIKILEHCGYSTIESTMKANSSVSEYLGQASILDEFVSNLSSAFISQATYTQEHEQNMVEIAAKTLGKDEETEWGRDWIFEIDDLLSMGTRHPFNTSATIAMFITGQARAAHYPELCLAWIDSLEGEYKKYYYYSYRKIFVNCPVNVSVYDSENNLVGQIINDEAQEIENGIVTYVDDNGQKIAILPTDEEYSVQLKATADGTMTYTVSEFDGDRKDAEKVVSYFNVEISDGETITGNIENLENVSSAEYELVKEDSEESIIPSVAQEGDEVQEFEAVVSASGSGTATGGGNYLIGEFAKVTAVPDSGAEFIGWYIGDELVSTDIEHRILVESSVTITAKFTKKTTTTTGGGGGLSAGGDKSTAGADNLGNTDKEETTAPEETPVVTPIAPAGGFSDLGNHAWAADAITKLVEQGVIKGTSATTYSPANNIIRADFAVLIVRLFNLSSANEENFDDVATADYFASELAIARNTNVVNGIGNNKFAPRSSISRQDMMVMIYRAMTTLGVELEPAGESYATDFDTVSDYAKEAVSVLMANGIINGKNGKVDPMASATRAEVAVMLSRVLDLIK